MNPSRFASTFYAGFVLLALGGAVWAVVEDPGGKDRVSLYGKATVVGDTPVAVNTDGEVGIHDGGNSITVDGTVAVTDGAGALNVIVDSGALTATVTDGSGALNVIVDSITAGDNNIGNVDIASIAAGDNNIGNVDIASALPAGTNAIGKLAANSGVDIGDVDVTSIAAGDNNIGNVDIVSGTITTVTTVTNVTGGTLAHDAGASGANPLLTGCYSSAAAPSDVSADTESTREWCLRNGARATVITAAGALVGGDATNGLDVDVTRFPDNEPFNVAQINGVTPLMGAGNTGTGSPRVTIATDQAAIATHGHGATAAAVPSGAQLQGFRSDGGLAAGTAALTAPVICQDSAVVSASTDNDNNEIVALTASETIYVCGLMLIADGTATFQLITGTGTACASGETNKSGDIPLVANSGFSTFSPFAFMKGAAGDAFCIEITGTANIQGWVSYTKF